MDLNKKNKEPAVRHCWQILWIPGQVIQTFITVKCRWHWENWWRLIKKKGMAQVCPIPSLLNTTSSPLRKQHGGGHSERQEE